VRHLLHNGYEVSVLDNLSKGRADYLTGLDVTLFQFDIRDASALDSAFDGVDLVVHLAAVGSVVESGEATRTNFEMNVLGTFNILEKAVKHNIKKLVFSSTGGALIGNAIPPVNEQSLPKPISPYGAGKLCCEAYCHAFSEVYGLNTVCTRFANVYGPYCDHKKGVINQFYNRINAGEPLIIYGDGSSTRDYIYVDDLCDGIFRALTNQDVSNEVIHFASGNEVSFKELAELMIKLSGKSDHPIEYHEKRVGEVDRNFAKYDYAKLKLGVEPNFSIEDGLSRTLDWVSEKHFS
jgi:UDP-glucose 4-epimerase